MRVIREAGLSLARWCKSGDGTVHPYHAAVLLDGGYMLHHPASLRPYDTLRLSYREPLERWKRHVTYWLRYEG